MCVTNREERRGPGRVAPGRVQLRSTTTEHLTYPLLQIVLLDCTAYVGIATPLLQRPGEDAAAHPAAIDEISHGQAEQTVLISHFAVNVDRYREFHAEIFRVPPRDRLSFLHVYCQHQQALVAKAFICRDELGDLLAAGRAPRRPEVQHHRLPA